jgi:hypothetical protein
MNKTMPSNRDDIVDDKVYVVSVDSRGKATSDMSSYKEQTCSASFFSDHIKGNVKIICVESLVARLCGLDLRVYFHLHSPLHHSSDDDHHIHKPLCTNVNGIATLLTFNPETGYYNNLVLGKAYVLLDSGTTALSSHQLWGIVELISESKNLYHQNHRRISEEANQELRRWVEQYRAQTWVPRSIYEPRRPQKPVYFRLESGMSDQATCHHGDVHLHHGDHLNCGQTHEDDILGTSVWAVAMTSEISVDLGQHEADDM